MWARQDIINLPVIKAKLRPSRGEDVYSRSLRDCLFFFHAPSTLTQTRGLKYVLAAIALLGSERDTQPQPLDFSAAANLSKPVQDALDAANYYNNLYSQSVSDKSMAKTVAKGELNVLSALAGLVQEVLKCAAAFATIRSLCHQIRALGGQPNLAETAQKEYNDLIAKLKLELEARNLAPLVAFLTGGVKCLMSYSHAFTSLTQAKLMHFLVIAADLNQSKPIDEPIWKRTSSLIIKFLEAALFPNGISQSVLSEGMPKEEDWARVNLDRWHVAHALKLDFQEFCSSHPNKSDSSTIPIPLWKNFVIKS